MRHTSKWYMFFLTCLILLLSSCSTAKQESSPNDFNYIPKADEYVDDNGMNAPNSEVPAQETSEAEIPPGAGEYDEILASGDGYFLVSKRVENYKEAYTEYGIIDQGANWLVSLAGDNEIANAIAELPCDRDSMVDEENRFEYANDGMFVARKSGYVIPDADENWSWSAFEQMYGCCMINAKTGHCFNVGPFTTRYYDGYCFFLKRNLKMLEVIRMDTSGEESVFYSDPCNSVQRDTYKKTK